MPPEASGRTSSAAAMAPAVRQRRVLLWKLQLLNVGGLRALGASLGLVGHARALGQRLEAISEHRRVMDEEVLSGFIGRDESVPLVVVEPLHGSLGHCCF